MLTVFLNTLPFFGLIALGFFAAFSGNFSREATAYLTKFVFYFPLSAMIFNFASELSLDEIFEFRFTAAYLIGSFVVYLGTLWLRRLRGDSFEMALVSGHCSVIGNMGWMGLAMLPILLGEESIPYVIMVLICDLVVFYPLIVSLIVAHRKGKFDIKLVFSVLAGLLKNPMVLSILTGLIWSTFSFNTPDVVHQFLVILAGASTPGALFAIGASMMYAQRGEYGGTALISLNKLLIHPLAVALVALYLFDLRPFEAAVLAACAAMPVAGNIYMLVSHYNIPSDRVSFSILVSTVVSILTIPLIIGLSFG
jgi:predicted permease